MKALLLAAVGADIALTAVCGGSSFGGGGGGDDSGDGGTSERESCAAVVGVRGGGDGDRGVALAASAEVG